MRTDQNFIQQYRETLASVDPSSRGFAIQEIRLLAITELCLHFVAEYLPGEDVSAVPYLMLGYPRVLDCAAGRPNVVLKLATLRHLCSRYISVAAWLDACRQHQDYRETVRCYSIIDRKPSLRRAASAVLYNFLADRLSQPVPWVQRSLQLADPGDAMVRVNHGSALLSYRIPLIPTGADQAIQKHVLTSRDVNPPIRITFDQMKAACRSVDERESRDDWPQSLPPLKLVERLNQVQVESLKDGFFADGTITLDGATHLVGMLSSGKSTLAWAVIFALTLSDRSTRIAMLTADTMQGAAISARLRLHGISATVLASLHNREDHLNSIHWQQGLTANGWSLSAIGDIAQGFSVACPLDGMQSEPHVVSGLLGEARFPSLAEKPCHRILQRAVPEDDTRSNDNDEDDDESSDDKKRSCPLWSSCPAQEQQRSSVAAQVLVMTPQAFVSMTPDKWVTPHTLTIPELVQFTVDLVIVDEVDSVQKTMDDIFAPRSPIMGDDRSVYVPAVASATSEALRERSGVQFRSEVNTKWQSNFYTFSRLVGMIYALLQNEEACLRPFYENTPFTAGSIFYELWRRRKTGYGSIKLSFDDPGVEDEFLELIKVASAVSRFSRSSSIYQDEPDENGKEEALTFRNQAFQRASEVLQDFARQILVADYYSGLEKPIQAALTDELAVFNASQGVASSSSQIEAALDRRANALAILLAIVTDLALSHYNWLIITQPAVAADFGIDNEHLFSHANNLLRHYRTLLPSNPAGAIFGLFYDRPPREKERAMGGKLTLVNHLGVGRFLITHLHDLLAFEGQAGPHVLMLSGTSWAGGSSPSRNPRTGKPMDAASPSYDVQVPVKGVLLQPDAELTAIKRSSFALVHLNDSKGGQIRVSGLPEKARREALGSIAERLGTRRDDSNILEDNWRRVEQLWSPEDVCDRRRALFVTNSYSDSVIVADSILYALEGHGYTDWSVLCLTRDRGDDGKSADVHRPLRARPLPRSLVETFGLMPERSILVAPLQSIARGHNILNRSDRAAISTIYFLHRPHPRPDDLAPIIGRLNRFAMHQFDKADMNLPDIETARVSVRARRMRHAATHIVRHSLDSRSGYSGLPVEYKAQFAWDMLTLLWQTVGRGIRRGCPVFAGFVDKQFAPRSFEGAKDSAASSVIVQAIKQLEEAMEPRRGPVEHRVAQLLYAPFYAALCKTGGLNYDKR